MFFAHVNTNSLVNKVHYIYSLLSDYNISVLGVSETWLTSSITSACISLPNYVLLRKDVVGNIKKHGVCVYIKQNIHYSEIEVQVPNVLVLYLIKYRLHIITVYRPPSNSPLDNAILVSFIEDFCCDKDVILMGDFNLPTIRWNNDLICASLSPTDFQFFHCFNSLGLIQWVKEPTIHKSGNIIDLIFTSEEDKVLDVQVLPPFPNCDHSPVMCGYVSQCSQSPTEIPPHRIWTRGNYEMINHLLSQIDWDFEFMYKDIDEMYATFLSVVNSMVTNYVPEFITNNHGSSWPVKPPLSLKRRRQIAWSQYKRLRCQLGRHSEDTNDALLQFLAINFQYRNFAMNKQVEYERSLVDSMVHNPKVFHAYIRNRKVNKVGVGPLKSDDGSIITDPQSMANIFATAFSSVYTRVVPPNPQPHQIFAGEIGNLLITQRDVVQAVSVLKPFSAMGPDEVHPYFLKACIDQLSYPLMLIFQASYSQGRLPHSWKSSLVVPIFKKGSKADPLKYRPVSLTSICCKSLERIITKLVFEYVEGNSLLVTDQYGFRSGRSTEDQLLMTYEDVTQSLDAGNTVDLILFDYSKAFDVISHELLLEKLSLLGITGNILLWIKDFLTDRVMNVVVAHTKSVPHRVTSGVPQGSVLGPLLFLLYINFVTSGVIATTKIFADDLKLYVSIEMGCVEGMIDAMRHCQKDIDTLFRVSESWGLTLNPSKCVAIRCTRRNTIWADLGQTPYHVNDTPIPFKDSATDLGITVDSKLKFHQHVANVVHKASGVALNILKATVNRDIDFMLPLFITYVRPLLEYASSVWNLGYAGDLRQLESVQRRWTKEIGGMRDMEYSQRLQLLNLYSVKGRLLRHDIIKYWQIFHDSSPMSREDLFPRPGLVTTRGHDYKIAHSRPQLEIRRRFFSMRFVDLWNSLPSHVVSCPTISAFKSALHTHLGDKLFEYVN